MFKTKVNFKIETKKFKNTKPMKSNFFKFTKTSMIMNSSQNKINSCIKTETNSLNTKKDFPSRSNKS